MKIYRFICVILPLLISAALVLSLIGNTEQDVPDYRALWNSAGIQNYQMRLVTLALPVPAIGLDLTVQKGEIVQQSIIACENPSAEYPESACETISRYYSNMGRYTVDQLFDFADECLRKTQIAIAHCPAFAADKLQRFSNYDDIFSMAHACQHYLESSDLLCSVNYDTHYGYPNAISTYAPNVMDGSIMITVKEFQPTANPY